MDNQQEQVLDSSREQKQNTSKAASFETALTIVVSAENNVLFR